MTIVERNAGDLNEGGDGVLELGEGADEVEGFDVRGELRPGLEAVLAGEDELCVGEDEGCGGELV